MTIPVSVIVLTKNEERNIPKCLQSVRDFDEVFVVDSGSEDRTIELAERFANTTTVDWRWDGSFPKKKQWALDNLPFSNDWVLYLDADEQLTPELRDEIPRVLQNNDTCSGFFVGYDNYFMQRRLRWGVHSMKLILLNRHKTFFDPNNEILVATMWEVEGNYQPTIDGKVGRLRAHAIHNDYKTMFDYFWRHNRYSDLEAFHRLHLGRISESYPPVRRILKRAFRKLPASGVLFFLYSYIWRLGILDGRAGLAFALARLCYSLQINCKVIELKTVPDVVESHFLNPGVQASHSLRPQPQPEMAGQVAVQRSEPLPAAVLFSDDSELPMKPR